MTRIAKPGPLIALTAVLLCCGRTDPAPPPVADASSLRVTPLGSVLGFRTEQAGHAWRGLPFASPPTGPQRWRAPHPTEPWTGTREALEFAAACPQFAMRGDGEPLRGDEDCLYANVFAPTFASSEVPRGEDRLPVMVWIHGGGNTIGDATVYNGSALAVAHDVVVVTVHYRLGVFGWFTHPALRAGENAADDRSGNYGTLDLVRALEWVRDNISSFGGDPDRVTIFGESAGGSNVVSLLRSPRAKGLFQRAIVQSGGARTTTIAQAENFHDDAVPGDEFSSREVLLRLLVRDGRAADRGDAKAQLAKMPDSEVASYLRSRSAAELLGVFEGNRLGGMYRSPEILSDGVVLPEAAPLTSFSQPGGYNQVPVLLGTNRDENKLFLLFGSEHVKRLFGFPLWLSEPDRYELEAEYSSLLWKASGVDELASAMRSVQGSSVYGYRFDWDEEPEVLWLDLGQLLGACHAIEIPFVFGILDLGPANRFVFAEDRRPAAEKLSNAMMSYWANFAYTGQPDRGRDGDLPRWSAWSDGAGPKFMLLDTDADGGLRMSSDAITTSGVFARIESDPRLTDASLRCGLYRGFVNWTDRMTPEQYRTIGDGACLPYPLEPALEAAES